LSKFVDTFRNQGTTRYYHPLDFRIKVVPIGDFGEDVCMLITT